MAVSTSLSTFNLLPCLEKQSSSYLGLRRAVLQISTPQSSRKSSRYHLDQQEVVLFSRLVVRATTQGSAKSSQSEEKIPSWAKPDSDEPPPWAREGGDGSSPQPTVEIPFYAYLLASALTAIAAIGSAFEYVNQNPVFGVINPDSLFYAPLLGFFAFTGIPTSAFLWYKSVQVANKEAEEQDRRDGYL